MSVLQSYFEAASDQADEAMGAGASMDFAALDRLCDAFAKAGAAEREALPEVDGWLRIALQAYAWYCAEQAVVRRDSLWIERGLTALVIEGGADPADHVMRLAVLFHSAGLLAVDGARLFADAGLAACTSDAAQGLEAFSIRAEQTEGAFHYRYEGGKRAVKKGWFRRRK